MKSFKRVTILVIMVLSLLSLKVLAAGNMSFSVGTSFRNLNYMEETVQQAGQCYANMGYLSIKHPTPTNDILKASYNGTKVLESDIVFTVGHGGYHHIEVANEVGIKMPTSEPSLKNFVNASDFNWRNVKLATFMACKTGQETANENVNIAYYVFKSSNWTTTTMGWRQEIYDVDAKKWSETFHNTLLAGGTVQNALENAGGQSYYSSTMRDLAFYGNSSLVLKKTRNVAELSKLEANKVVVKENIDFHDEDDIKNINTLLKNFNPNFEEKDYEINISKLKNDEEEYVISYDQKLGEYYTNQGYVIIVHNGKVEQIRNNMKNTNVDIEVPKETLTIEKVNSLKQMATNKVKLQELSKSNKSSEAYKELDIQIKEQKLKYYIDLETKEKKAVILTTYGIETNSNGGSIYEINI